MIEVQKRIHAQSECFSWPALIFSQNILHVLFLTRVSLYISLLTRSYHTSSPFPRLILFFVQHVLLSFLSYLLIYFCCYFQYWSYSYLLIIVLCKIEYNINKFSYIYLDYTFFQTNETIAYSANSLKYLGTEERTAFFCIFLIIYIVALAGNVAAIFVTAKR